jgi:hypothetical protein
MRLRPFPALAILLAVLASMLSSSGALAAETTTVLRLGNPVLSAQQGASVTLGMRFDAQPMSEDYGVFVHLVDASGNLAINGGDHAPPQPTSTWGGGVGYDHTVSIPVSAAPGQYSIRIGLFQTHSPWDRAELAAGDGVTVDDQLRYTVGTLTISGPSGPFGQNPADYRQTFSEEFNGAFDTNRWNDHIWYESPNPTINYKVADGSLKTWPQRDSTGNFFNRTIDTDGKYYQQYGYFEMEAKLPTGKGTWPGFWLFNHIDDRRPEIDIMEAYPGASGWGDANLHPTAFAATVWPNGSGGGQAGHRMLQTPDLSASFHKYAVKWEPHKQTFYFDGKEFFSLDVTMSDPMYILLDLWFGSASGNPDDTTPTGEGNSYEVNYVRAWQFR